MSHHLTLRPATALDAPTLVSIYLSAFTSDAISLLCFPRDSEAVRKWWLAMILDELRDPNAHFLVVVATSTSLSSSASLSRDGEGDSGEGEEVKGEQGLRKGVKEDEEIVSFCKWASPVKTLPPIELPTWPAGTDVQLANKFFGALFKHHRTLMSTRPHWYLELIATLPSWQGRGAASQLIRWGLAKADEQGVEVYLEASPAGKPIYERFGFRERERIVVDLEGRDPCRSGEMEFVEVIMVREGRK